MRIHWRRWPIATTWRRSRDHRPIMKPQSIGLGGYPLRLRKRLRSTNLLERSLGEVKRRTRVIGTLPWVNQLPQPLLGGHGPGDRGRFLAGTCRRRSSVNCLAAAVEVARQIDRRFSLLGVLAAAALLTGCGGAETGSADVEISGGLEAHAMASQATCEPAPGLHPGMLADFYLDLGGLQYGLRFLTDHNGPGIYKVSDHATFVALNGEGPGWTTLTDDAGRLVVNKDGRSGTLNVWLSPEPATGNQAIHVVGSWRCPPAQKH